MERLGRLKRFFSPQLAELIVSGGAQDPLRSHRRELTVLFLDLRGFTGFAERVEPEEVMEVLRDYHAAMGELILAHEGTLERFTGDGMMVFFNDPVPVPDPATRALQLALAMRERASELSERWQRLGYDLGMAIGMATGYATIGAIGFEGRWDYGAIGTVTNLAARLCAEARSGQILISHRLSAMVPDGYEVAPAGALQRERLCPAGQSFQPTRWTHGPPGAGAALLRPALPSSAGSLRSRQTRFICWGGVAAGRSNPPGAWSDHRRTCPDAGSQVGHKAMDRMEANRLLTPQGETAHFPIETIADTSSRVIEEPHHGFR